ncbi:MAG: hypothetical protein R2883_01350 [Caldisericia bacterium]
MRQLIDAVSDIDTSLSRYKYSKKLIEKLSDFLRFPSAMLIDSEGDSNIVAAHNMTETQSKGILDLISRSGISSMVAHINETLPPPWGDISKFHFRSLISIPLKFNKNRIGYIVLLSPKKHEISEDDFVYLNTISRIVSNGYSINKLNSSGSHGECFAGIDRSFLDQLKSGFLSYDTIGNIEYINPTLVAMLGSPNAEESKKINLFTFQGLVDSGLSESFRRAIKSGNTVFSTHTYVSKWGLRVISI